MFHNFVKIICKNILMRQYFPEYILKSHAAKEWIPLAKTFLMHQIFPETTEYEKNPFGIE